MENEFGGGQWGERGGVALDGARPGGGRGRKYSLAEEVRETDRSHHLAPTSSTSASVSSNFVNQSLLNMRKYSIAEEVREGERRSSSSVGLDFPSTASNSTDYRSLSISSSPGKKSVISDSNEPDNAVSDSKVNERNEDNFSEKDIVLDRPQSVNMSANMAFKLHQIRSSLENLEYASDGSFEDLEMAEELANMSVGELGPGDYPRRASKPSLRQIFPHISCLPFENNIVFCFVLSVWDNIVGPQAVYVWKRKSFPSQRTIEGMLDHKFELVNIDTDEKRQRQRRKSMDSSKVSDMDKPPSSPSSRKSDHGGSSTPKSPSRPSSAASQRRKTFSVQGRNSVDIGTFGSRVTEGHRTKSKSLGNLLLADAGGCEEGGSWACGRGRLRVGVVVKYVTEHTVGVGQMGPPSDAVLPSLLVVPHQGVIVVALRFNVSEDGCGVPYCLSMVVPLEEYHYFMPLTHTVTAWLVNITAVTRLLITKFGLEGGGRIRPRLVELCETLVALRSASLDQYPLSPAGKPPDDRRLAEILLTSHLQTMGCTLVVADSPNAANKVVMWVAQFSQPADLHVSRLCLSYTQWSFHPGLAIQGVVRGSNGEVNLSAQKLIQSARPLTVFDASRGTVKRTGSPDVHARRNAAALHQELLSLWHDLPDVAAPSQSLLEPVRVAAPLVRQFLHDYDRLASCEPEVRQGFVRAFLRSLQYTALALITWTRQEWTVQNRRSSHSSLRQALYAVFDLDESDLRVILAQAEHLHPGFYAYVMA